jgi:hypothetical protein
MKDIAQRYCLCSVLGTPKTTTLPYYIEDFHKMSKNDINLQLLKEFEYETEEMQDPKDGSFSTIYK